jgi:hypothetical protein
MAVSLAVAAEGRTPALLLRPWQPADMPGLLAAMDHEYPAGGLRPNPYVAAGPRHWTGPRDDNEAAIWLSGQDRGWQSGDWLALAAVGQHGRVAGQVGLTRWAFSSDGLPLILLVHDLGNRASCRVAEKRGYQFTAISPANPPLWHAAGHVHVALSQPGAHASVPPGVVTKSRRPQRDPPRQSR